MIPQPRLLALYLLMWPAPLIAQLPLITVPHRTLRFELGGAFGPTRDAWRNGTKVGVGSLLSGPLDANATPLVGDLERDLFPLLGRRATPSSLGGLTTIAEWQHNVGKISLAWGVSPKVTLIGTVPIVSVRTERKSTFDPAQGNLGLNPANATLGTAAGQARTQDFFDSFGSALAELDARIDAGEYSGATLQLAQQTAASGVVYFSALLALMNSNGSPVLPLAGSTDGVDLLSQIAAIRARFTTDLEIPGFTGEPALPTTPMNSNEFAALLAAPTGFDIRRTSGQPLTGIGRIELGAVAEIFRRNAEGNSTAMTGWGRALVRLGTGAEPSQFALMDQGTGGRQHQFEVGGTLDLSRPSMGVRGDVSLNYSLATGAPGRLGAIGQFLLPVSRRTTIARRNGPGLGISAQPWIRLVPRLAVTGLVTYNRRGGDHLSFDGETPAFYGLNPSDLTAGSAASSLRVGLGLNYLHTGVHHDGAIRMPVEAGFSIERTITSGGGIVPSELTSKVFLRVYRPLKKQ